MKNNINKHIVFLFFLFFCTLSIAQKYDNVWQIGYGNNHSAGFGNIKFHFDNDTLQIDTTTLNMNFSHTSASICDYNGNILFYSNGVYINNQLNDTMQNSYGINPTAYTLEPNGAQLYGLKILQGMAILRDIKDTTLYHLFHLSYDYLNFGSTYHPTKLFHSVVDMTGDNGLGIVTIKNEILINDTINSQVIATKHANGRDWWILLRMPYTDVFYTLLLNDKGISAPFIQQAQVLPACEIFNQVSFSPDGTKIAGYNPVYGVWLYDFDRCTGFISNGKSISINGLQTQFRNGGVAFSPNSKLLYVSSTTELYQYNLEATDIASSKITIDIFDGYQNPYPAVFCALYLAPDNKIYVAAASSCKTFGVIHNPNLQGMGCNFIQHSLMLPYRNTGTVPNYVNYRLGALVGSACDTLLSNQSAVSSLQVKLYPNPAQDMLTIQYEGADLEGVELRVYDNIGRVYCPKVLSLSGHQLQIRTADWAEGLYILQITHSKGTVYEKFVIKRG